MLRICTDEFGCDDGGLGWLKSADDTCGGKEPATTFICPPSGVFTAMLSGVTESTPFDGAVGVTSGKPFAFPVKVKDFFKVEEGSVYGNMFDEKTHNPNIKVELKVGGKKNQVKYIIHVGKLTKEHTGVGSDRILFLEDSWAAPDPAWTDAEATLHGRFCLTNVPVQGPGGTSLENLCGVQVLDDAYVVPAEDPANFCNRFDQAPLLGDIDHDDCPDGLGNKRKWPLTIYLHDACDLPDPGASEAGTMQARTQVERGLRGRRERDLIPVGTIVGAYAVEEAVAEGGFASLYRAVRLEDERPVAMKVLHRDLAASPRVQARFRREAEAIRRLDHPRIVSVLDHGTLTDGRPYLVMEWVEGRPLSDELSARGRLPWAEVVDLVSQIADALESAHSCGVIHRDLKAENVIVSGQSPRLSAVLVDFGLAKILADEASSGDVLTTASPMGTPISMAPEQILSQVVDTRVDVYALGVLMFQMAAGRPPFSLPDLAALLEAHLHAPPPRLSDLVPAPPEVDEVIASCLAKEPAERPSSPGRAAAALRRAVASGNGASMAVEPVDVLCAAVYVVACPPDGGGSNDTLDRLDDLVEAARSRLLAAGMTITWEIGNALLAVAPAPQPGQRRTVLDAARDLAGPELAVFVHADFARLVGGRCVGGPLCHIAEWTDPRPVPGRVAASRSILDNLDRRPAAPTIDTAL